MSETGERQGADRLRATATRVAARVGGVSAVRALITVLAVYDGAGGGLLAGGLAYTSLLALLPGLLLLLSFVGLIVQDPVGREQIVGSIAAALPPLENIARASFEQVSAGAVPTGIVAVVGLLWGSSRFYAALDNAFARIFHNAPRRNELVRTVRGIATTGLFVALPVAALVAGSIASWVLDMAPSGLEVRGIARGVWQLASPLGSLVLFTGGTALVYRFVPAARVPVRALGRPAIVSGLVLAGFTQLFTFVAPRLVGVAALYGAFVAVFAVLAWLSVSFNVLLLGAAWTRVRQLESLGLGEGPMPAAIDSTAVSVEEPERLA